MPIVGGLDIHRKQITFDYFDTGTGQVRRGQVSPADRVHLRAWLPAQRALRLFATANDANGWAYLENYGWAHLAGGSHPTTNKLAELTHARSSGHPVSPFINGTELSSVLVAD